MAVAAFSLTNGTDAVAANPAVTASHTPTANRLVLLAVINADSVGSNGLVPTSVTGNSLTWVFVAGTANGTFPNPFVSLWRAMGSSPTAGATSINFSGAQGSVNWSIVEFSGVDTSGTNGSGAIVQSLAVTGNGTTALATLSAFASTDNATYGACGKVEIAATTPGAGFTEIHDNTVTGPHQSMQTQWRVDNDTTVDASWTTAQNWVEIGVELKAAAAGVAAGPAMPTAARVSYVG